MAKDAKSDNDIVVTDAATVETEGDISLDEFCLRLSNSDKRVELIAAFNHVEGKDNRIKDTETAYRSRFDAFINAPA